jgi:uncharacterized small protein (DUF1192 family)
MADICVGNDIGNRGFAHLGLGNGLVGRVSEPEKRCTLFLETLYTHSPNKRRIAMFDDDEVKKPKGHEVGMNIETMSVEELTDRIGLLEGEIARLRAAIAARQKSRNDANSVFKF